MWTCIRLQRHTSIALSSKFCKRRRARSSFSNDAFDVLRRDDLSFGHGQKCSREAPENKPGTVDLKFQRHNGGDRVFRAAGVSGGLVQTLARRWSKISRTMTYRSALTGCGD